MGIVSGDPAVAAAPALSEWRGRCEPYRCETPSPQWRTAGRTSVIYDRPGADGAPLWQLLTIFVAAVPPTSHAGAALRCSTLSFGFDMSKHPRYGVIVVRP